MKEKIEIILITNTDDITTDFIVKSLNESKANFYRFNTNELGKTVKLYLNFQSKEFILYDTNFSCEINLLDIKSVYFRRPEVTIPNYDLTKGEFNFIKSEILYTLEGLYKILQNAFWINNVYKIRNAENKIYQLLLAEEIGFSTPDSLITNLPEKAYDFFKEKKSSCILKPIKSGLVEGEIEEGVIFTNEIHLNKENAERIALCPTYFQNRINKKGDLRITVVNDSIFAAFIHSQDETDSKTDWRKSVSLLKHSKFNLSDDISNKCLKLLKRLELNFGAIDFIIDHNDNLIFLEINPNGQWAWIEKRLNYPISKEITKILIEKSFK